MEDKIPVIPDRLYNRIGDVAEIIGVKPYVLRYWESEFPIISPKKNNSGQRVYSKSDIETVLLIKRLLYNEKYSIEGAKKKLRELRHTGELQQQKKQRVMLDESKINVLMNVRNELQGLLDILETDPV